jgi:hypothetical protein
MTGPKQVVSAMALKGQVTIVGGMLFSIAKEADTNEKSSGNTLAAVETYVDVVAEVIVIEKYPSM